MMIQLMNLHILAQKIKNKEDNKENKKENKRL
jgi:hypothetical protein